MPGMLKDVIDKTEMTNKKNYKSQKTEIMKTLKKNHLVGRKTISKSFTWNEKRRFTN